MSSNTPHPVDILAGIRRRLAQAKPGSRLILLAAVVLFLGCEGTISDAPMLEPVDPLQSQEEALTNGRLRARLWPLTPTQYETHARDLLGDLPEVGRYPAGANEDGFSNVANGLTFDRAATQRLVQIADDYSAWAQENAGIASGCGNDFGSDECVASFIDRFTRQAYRRSVSADERAELRRLYDEVTAEHGAEYGFRMLVKTVLISPKTLYRTELGGEYDGLITADAPEGGQIVVLEEFEIANLLSFALTNGPPDEELLAAAEAGLLRDGAERRRQSERLMALSHGVWQRFFWEWLHMNRFGTTADALSIPASLQASMLEEFDEFIGRTVVDERGSLDDVFASTRSWASPELAEHYGVAHPGDETSPHRFRPDGAGRPPDPSSVASQSRLTGRRVRGAARNGHIP